MDEMIAQELIPTGVPGLDDILHGGLAPGNLYVLSGSPGTGKTTLCMQFIGAGIRNRERCLYVTIATVRDDLPAFAEAMGFALDPELFSVYVVDISEQLMEGPEKRIFHPAEMELSEVMKGLLAEVKRVKPQRLVIDSLSDLEILSEEMATYRRLLFSLLREFGDSTGTVLLTNYGSTKDLDLHLESIAHGVIRVEQLSRDYGPTRRRLMIAKMRMSAYRSGWHDFKIERAGLRIFPTLLPREHRQKKLREKLFSGNEQLDALLGGGLSRGSSSAVVGASGTGKTTLANLYVVAAARRGEHSAIYLFEETDESYLERAEGLGLPIDDFIAQGLITLRQVNIAEFSPGEFISMIRQEVEEKNARVIVIDTLSGYASAMPGEKNLTIQFHELLIYLTQKGVTTFVIVEQHGLFGLQQEMTDISYLADTILLLRYFEHRGQIRRAISVIKKRRGKHRTEICELIFSEKGIQIGEPLKEMHGVLTGVPTLEK